MLNNFKPKADMKQMDKSAKSIASIFNKLKIDTQAKRDNILNQGKVPSSEKTSTFAINAGMSDDSTHLLKKNNNAELETNS